MSDLTDEEDQGCTMRARYDLGHGVGGVCSLRKDPVCPRACLLLSLERREAQERGNSISANVLRDMRDEAIRERDAARAELAAGRGLSEEERDALRWARAAMCASRSSEPGPVDLHIDAIDRLLSTPAPADPVVPAGFDKSGFATKLGADLDSWALNVGEPNEPSARDMAGRIVAGLLASIGEACACGSDAMRRAFAKTLDELESLNQRVADREASYSLRLDEMVDEHRALLLSTPAPARVVTEAEGVRVALSPGDTVTIPLALAAKTRLFAQLAELAELDGDPMAQTPARRVLRERERAAAAAVVNKCARTACFNKGQHPHRDLPGLYCTPCGKQINAAAGVTLVVMGQQTPSEAPVHDGTAFTISDGEGTFDAVLTAIKTMPPTAMSAESEAEVTAGVREWISERAALRRMIEPALAAHPLPWCIEHDWTIEVTAADGATIAKCLMAVEAEMIIEMATAVQTELDAPLVVDGVDLRAPAEE